MSKMDAAQSRLVALSSTVIAAVTACGGMRIATDSAAAQPSTAAWYCLSRWNRECASSRLSCEKLSNEERSLHADVRDVGTCTVAGSAHCLLTDPPQNRHCYATVEACDRELWTSGPTEDAIPLRKIRCVRVDH